jgi:hypothetical protein
MNGTLGVTLEDLKIGIETVERQMNAGREEYEVLEQMAEVLGNAKMNVEKMIMENVERR